MSLHQASQESRAQTAQMFAELHWLCQLGGDPMLKRMATDHNKALNANVRPCTPLQAAGSSSCLDHQVTEQLPPQRAAGSHAFLCVYTSIIWRGAPSGARHGPPRRAPLCAAVRSSAAGCNPAQPCATPGLRRVTEGSRTPLVRREYNMAPSQAQHAFPGSARLLHAGPIMVLAFRYTHTV